MFSDDTTGVTANMRWSAQRRSSWAVLVAVTLAAGCATVTAPQQGVSGPVAWRVEDVRVSDDPAQGTRLWHYTLVLRETAGVGVTFERVATLSRPGAGQPSSREERGRLRLEPFAELRLSLSDGVRAPGTAFSALAAESLPISRTFHGISDGGRPVSVRADYVLPSAPPRATEVSTADLKASIAEGAQLVYQGRLSEAEARFNAVLARQPDADLRAAALLGMAGVLMNRGEVSAAQARAEQAEAIARDPEVRRSAAGSVGMMRLAQGQVAAAEGKLAEALLASGPDIRAMGMLGLAEARYFRLREEVRTRLDLSSPKLPGTPTPQQVRDTIRQSLGRVFSRSPDGRKLKEMYREAARLAQTPAIRHPALVFLAQMHLLDGEYAEARRLLEAVLREAPSVWLESQIHLALGLLPVLAGDFRQAARELDRALALLTGDAGVRGEIPATLGTVEMLTIKALVSLALSQEASGSEARAWLDEAVRAIRLALDLNDRIRGGIQAHEARMSYMALPIGQDLLDYTTAIVLISSAMAGHNVGNALEIAERGRARTLLEQLTARRAEGMTLPAGLAERERVLLGEIDRLQQALSRPTGLVEQLRAELVRAQRALDAFVDGLRRHPERAVRAYATVNYPTAPTVDELERALRPDEALIEYKVTAWMTFAWIVRRGHPVRVVPIRIGRSELRSRVTAFLDTISRPPSAPFDPAPARALYDLLLGEILKDVQAGTSLILVPDEALLLLPFEALARGSGGAAEYLAAMHPVRYYPSAGTFLVSRSDPSPRGPWSHPLLALADPRYGDESGHAPVRGTTLEQWIARGYGFAPLPATRREVTEVSRLLQVAPRPPHVLLREYAVKQQLLRREAGHELARYRFIHFATHGVLATDIPSLRQPALVLGAPAPGAAEADMFLTMDEIAGLRLAADLVVLSACQTGRGEEVPGEGVLGLTRAVLHAGAASVVVSLWNVADEATATFMSRFYSHLVRGGLDKARALQQARLDLLRDRARSRGGYDHPFFWAAFILAGDDGA
jgi:CHAT domain-containing protein